MLDAVVADGHAAVIRGAPGPFYPRDCSPAFRLLQPQAGLASTKTGARISQERIRTQKLEPDEEHRYAVTWLPTFVDHPRCWTILDIDRVRAPSVSDVGEATLERSGALSHILLHANDLMSHLAQHARDRLAMFEQIDEGRREINAHLL